MRTLLALILLLSFAATASAKEIAAVQLCGAHACRAVAGGGLDVFTEAGAVAPAPSRAEPWYTLRVTIRPEAGEKMKPFTLRNAYVPGSQLLRVRDEAGTYTWYRMEPAAVRRLGALAATVDPRPAAALRGWEPAPGAPRPAAADAGGATWRWPALGAVCALLAVAAIALARRRRGPRPAAA